MFCKNEFCVYQNKGKCTLSEVELDAQGQCENCIYFDVDYKLLKELKIKTLMAMSEELPED